MSEEISIAHPDCQNASWKANLWQFSRWSNCNGVWGLELLFSMYSRIEIVLAADPQERHRVEVVSVLWDAE